MVGIKITTFKDWKGKKRYQVMRGFRFLGGGFASRKTAEKHRKWVIKHKKQLMIIRGHPY